MKTQLAEARSPGRADAAFGKSVVWTRVRAVRLRLRRLLFAEAALRVVGVLGLGLFLGVVLDAWLEVPRAVRAATTVLAFAAAVLEGWRAFWLPWRALPDRDALALYVERQRPALRSRLISAVQLGRAEADSAEATAFVRRLVDDAGRAAGELDPVALAPASALRRVALRVVPGCVALLLTFWLTLPTSMVLLRRAFLEEIALPRRTRIVEVSAPRTLGRGDDFKVAVRVEGRIPRTGRLWVRHESGRLQELSLDPELEGGSEAGRFSRVIAGVPASFHYRLRLNDAETLEFPVEVLPRPLVTNLVLTQILPAYTGLAPRRVMPGELTLLRGSRLRVGGSGSQPLQRAHVRLTGTVERFVELAVGPAESPSVAGEFEIDDPGLAAFSIDLVDVRGIPSRDPAVYALDVVEDQPPAVKILAPVRREELVTARGTVLLAFEARDDFGLGALRIRHQPALATNGEVATIELDLTGETNAVVRRRFEWRLSTLQPPLVEGGMHEFWVEATDRRDARGPGLGRSERYLLRVVTEAEKRADLLGRAGDAIGRLGDVAQGQERLNQSLGRIIVARPDAP